MARLSTKLRRELVASRWQFIAVAATVMLGIGFFHGSLVSYSNLSKSYDLTYRRLAFADVWVPMAAAPDSFVDRVDRLPGVRRAIGRIVQEIRVAQENRSDRNVVGRMISLPAAAPDINRVRVIEGSYFSPQGGREALLELSFAKAQHYRVGEYIYPTIDGREIRFRVVGLVQSPEYIYAIQSEQYLVATPGTFGVMFIPHRQAEVLFGMSGEVNEICAATDPGQRRAVANLVGRLAARYGGEKPITREEQPSNKLLMMDLDGYRTMAVIFPLLFITATALTTYTLLARMVQAQRAQIGVLRAVGFSQRSILSHFLALALVPSAIGGIFGIGLGHLFAWSITRLYVVLINIPDMYFSPRFDIALAGLLIAAAAGFIGAISPARLAARLPPAVAMTQQEMSERALPTAVRWLGRGLPLALRLPLRNLTRRPRRTIYTVLGIALGTSLTILSFGMVDAVEHATVTLFEEIERYDVAAGFAVEQGGSIVSHVQSWPGVHVAEPTLAVPIEIERQGVVHKTILEGLNPAGQLRRLTTADGRRLIPQPEEVLMGDTLRKKLGVDQGDLLLLSYAQNRREFRIERAVRVGPTITQPIGATMYIRKADLQRLFTNRLGCPQHAAGGVLIRADADRVDSIRTRLHRMPFVASVQTRAQTHRQIRELMKFTQVFTGILAFFGVGLAFAVVFTAVSITVLERTRELATLRTLGFRFRRVAWLTTAESLAIALVGIALGLPLGRLLDIYLLTSAQSEAMTLQPVIFLRTYVLTVVGILLLTALSQIPSLFQIRRMNLASATKELSG